MAANGVLSKERLVSGLRSLSKLRIKASHRSILLISALALILFIAFTIRLLPMRWEIPNGASLLSEFDPYYQFSLTRYMVQNGLFSPYGPTPWVNTQSWYPQGLDMSYSLPSLPMTTAVLYQVASAFGLNLDLMTFSAMMPIFLATLSCLLIFFIGKDVGGKAVGLFAAFLLALSPSFIARTSLGFFDTESIGIFALLLFIYTFLRAIEKTRPIPSMLKYSVVAGGALALFICGWGASYFMIGLALLFVLTLILLKRYSRRLLFSYSLTFGLGIFLATFIPRFSTTYLLTAPVLAVAGVFVLLCLVEVLRVSKSARTRRLVVVVSLAVMLVGFVALWQLGYMQDIAGKFITVLNPLFRSLQPLIESVAEHRITAWGSIYYELGIGILFFLAGLYLVLKNPTNRNVFLLLFGITSLYFAGSMVRLLNILAPAYSLLAAIGILGMLKPFYALLRTPEVSMKSKRGLKRVGKEYSIIAVLIIFLLLMTTLVFSPQNGGVPRVYGQAYSPITISAGSLPIVPPNEPVREWINMLIWTRDNLQATTIVSSWWDYGYWLTNGGNVTSLADNATINATQIENIGFSFMANETLSLEMLERYDAEYVLVFTTLGISTDSSGQYVAYDAGFGDEGKWMWMARISGNAADRFIEEGLLDEETAWTDESDFGSYNNETGTWEWNEVGMNTTIYKMMSWAKERWTNETGFVYPDRPGIEPEYFKEVFFSGVELDPFYAAENYFGIVPLVSLWEIDWEKYYSDTQIE